MAQLTMAISPALAERFPDYSACVVVARGFAPGLYDAAGHAAAADLHAAEREARHRFGEVAALEHHPGLAAWRAAYRTFGAPKRTVTSPEAMLRRILKAAPASGDSGIIPSVNPLVDVANAVSLRYVLPVGAEDPAGVDGTLHLRFAVGTEPFEPIAPSHDSVEYPERSEVIWADSRGVTCRCWNWRQSRRTMITRASTGAYFVLDCLPPDTLGAATAAADMLIELLRDRCGARTTETHVLEAGGTARYSTLMPP